MILNEFPDLAWLKTQISNQFANGAGWGGRILKQSGWPTVILNTTTDRVHRDNIPGPLSFFSNVHGTSFVTVDKRRVRVSPGFFFLSNPGQHYTLEINHDGKERNSGKTETLNIHFGDHFGDDVIASLSKRPEQLLENPFERSPTGLNFYNRLYPMDVVVKPMIHSLHEVKGDGLDEEEKLYRLLSYLSSQMLQLDESRSRIPALKASTREEIIRRLFSSTDYIYTFYDKDISLDELAQVSCLSKFHYLRLFKIAFEQTPHQFITQIRVQRAKELLRLGKLEVAAISQKVGFNDPSSFSRLFRKQTGVYPTQFKA